MDTSRRMSQLRFSLFHELATLDHLRAFGKTKRTLNSFDATTVTSLSEDERFGVLRKKQTAAARPAWVRIKISNEDDSQNGAKE